MTKRLVEIDDELLADAREALAAATIRETVERSLREAVAVSARRRELARLEGGGLPDLADPEVTASAWR